MKTLQKLKLTAISKADLESKAMDVLRGGYNCSCGCSYADTGGSTKAENKNANIAKEKLSEGYSACDSCFENITVTWK